MSASPIPTPVLPRTKSDLRQAMSLLSREILASCAVSQVGTLQAVYPDQQLADITINSAIIVGYQTLPSGQMVPVTKTYPVFPKVPIIYLGGGGAALTFPVAPGDTCLLIFLDRDSDNWILSGQTDLPPSTPRLHSYSDAVAIVGLRSQKAPLGSFSTQDAQLYGTEGPEGPLVSIGGGKVGIGNAAGQLKTALDSLCSALASAVIAGTTFNPATIAAIEVAKAEIDAILK